MALNDYLTETRATQGAQDAMKALADRIFTALERGDYETAQKLINRLYEEV